MVKKLNSISFESLAPGSAVGVTEDGLIVAVDLVMAITGKNRNDAAHCLRELKCNLFNRQNFIIRRMPGSGNSKTKCLTLEAAVRLIEVLPGDMAKQFRVQACDILKRYLAGDQGLVAEIAHNSDIGVVAACQEFLGKAFQCVKRKREEEDIVVAYVYGTESEAFPGLIKIGETVCTRTRLSSMNTGCAPKPHKLVAVAATFHSARDERMAHAFFDDFREEGEFFRVTAEEVQRFFDRYITPLYLEESTAIRTSEHVLIESVIPECIGNSKEPTATQVDDLIELKRQLCEFLEAHLIAKEHSRISTAEISQTFLRMQGMLPEKLDNKTIVDLMNKTIKLAVDGLPGSECVRRNYPSARGLKQMTVYRGIDWVEGDVSEHVAAVRATYSDAQLAEDVC